MTDANPGSTSSGEQTIPKQRLDEVIAQRNRVEQEAAYLRGQLAATQRQIAPREQLSDPEMEALKAENPAMYKKHMQLLKRTQELSAGFSTLADQTDRNTFVQDFGPEAKKRIQDVEAVLANERANGRFGATRSGIYQWMLGQEKLQADAQRAAAPATPPPAQSNDAPPSDPKFAATVNAGTAGNTTAPQTREQRIAELSNVEF